MKLATLLLVTALLLWGCGDKKADNPEKKPTTAGTELPANLFVDKIDGAVSIVEARKLKPGDKVTVTGKVMGAEQVFVDGRAFLVLGDPTKMTSCDLKPDDPCRTPWDVCCDDEKDIKEGTLSVQVLDANGKILKTGLKGKSGLKELAFVTVVGTVSADSTADTMTINAEKISVSEKAK